MKSIFSYLIAGAMIALCGCTTTSDSFRQKSVSKTVLTGEKTKLGQTWHVNKDCSFVDYLSTHVIEQPKHGRFQLVREPVFPYEKGELAKCRTVKVQGEVGYYISEPGYIGSDKVVVRSPSGNGRVDETIINVNVVK
ncbi:hypothetical protein HFO93_09655 [Rhizobium leguminosarum]|uniref:hypothetical protein n=1 Tax=Rhizobium leguminosarum TaxID=384 RepID=UPI001C96BCAF|nr:hypothetical protein [Rhizobium leguminosarum]MBY5443743.1 hypothetical protein [Rhizobium leguminosarum]